MTHWYGCWLQGPEHYGCAVTRIRTLERDVRSWLDMAHGQRRRREEVEAERDLLREFMRDACAALKCEQNDEAALLAIDELCVERDRLREALEKIAYLHIVIEAPPTISLAQSMRDIARAALEGKP